MALSWSEQVLPAGSQTVPVEIAYLDRAYIHLYVNGAEQTDFTWDSDTLIRFGTQLDESSTITIVRRTERSYLYILFAEGAAFIKENLDTQNTQFLHLAQELVEGRAIEGFYGDISMNGYKITNLAPGTALTDAANVGQVQEVSDRVTSLEQNFVIDATSSYPWYTITTAESTSFTPPFAFTKAAVYLNGVCQTPGYSYDILNNVVHLAEKVPAGTHVFMRLGEDVPNDQGYATAASLAAAIAALEADIGNQVTAQVGPAVTAAIAPEVTARTAADAALQVNIDSKAAAGANSDIHSLSGLTTALSIAQGGTGNMTGLAASATQLATARTVQVNLASTTAASFNGTANISPGVTGILPVANGGTGASSAAAARTGLGAAASGANSDITSLTGLTGGVTGTVLGAEAGAGVVGQVLTATSTADVPQTTATVTSLVQLALTPGDWDVQGAFYANPTGATISTIVGGISTSATTVPDFPYRSQHTASVVVAEHATVPYRRFNVTANTTIYLTSSVTFSGGTLAGKGYLTARRAR